MATNLNFSTGQDHRVSVQVGGWTREDTASFVAAANAGPGVVDVRSAGGGTSYYIDYDPALTAETTLKQHLTAAAERVLGRSPTEGSVQQTSPSSITIDGENVTIDGATLDGGTSGPTPPSEPEINSSSWTGIADVRERVIAVKKLLPTAISAVDTLIIQFDVLGDNRGPPLEDRQEALDALRGLHYALGSLLALAETPNFKWAENEGLASACVNYASRLQKSLRDDPLPYATASLILAICTALNFPGAGALLATFAFQKQSKPNWD